MSVSFRRSNGLEVITIENEELRVEIVPAIGGKIISIYNKLLEKEFLWTNPGKSLELHQAGVDYDSNFLGGIDELLPNDIPERVDSVDYPDHGELWTTVLDYRLDDEAIVLCGKLKLSELYYEKTVSLDSNSPIVHLRYRIRNDSDISRNFLWKLHAAISVEEGDQLVTSARKAKVVDPAYSRFKYLDEFNWPVIKGVDASVVPPCDNAVDFFYLYDVMKGEMNFMSNRKEHLFRYSYDLKVFPYQWYFASYGGFYNHYTVILEPCSSMPISVNDAKKAKQCSVLKPNEELKTSVSIYAGRITI